MVFESPEIGGRRSQVSEKFDNCESKSPANIVFELRQSVRSFDIKVSENGTETSLIIPDFYPIPTNYYNGRVLKKKRAPGEVSTIAAMSYFFDEQGKQHWKCGWCNGTWVGKNGTRALAHVLHLTHMHGNPIQVSFCPAAEENGGMDECSCLQHQMLHSKNTNAKKLRKSAEKP